MSDRRKPTFHEQMSTWLLPITLGLLGYMAKSNYEDIKGQLNRIEDKQVNATAEIAQVKMRLLVLEQARQAPDTPATPQHPTPPPAARRR